MTEGRLVRAFAGGRTVRLVIAEARGPAIHTRHAHGLGPGSAVVAAEGVVATALLSAHIKGQERITLQLQASDPRCAFIGEIDAEGAMRARLTPPDLPLGDGRIDGILFAIKADAHRELYRGTTEVRSQSLEAALGAHLGTSTQVDAILRLGTRLSDNGEIAYAGGFLVERLPEDPKYPWIAPDEFQARYGGLRDGDLEEILTSIAFGKLVGTDIEVLESRPVKWQCRCSREKVEAMLGSLGVDELRAMKADGGAEVTCHFCSQVYKVSVDRLEQLIQLYLPN